MESANQRALTRLNEWFGEKTPDFVRALKASDALIAGGFAVSALVDETFSTDLDIYVQRDSLVPIMSFLSENMRSLLTHQVSPYSCSFMKRNGIIARFSFAKDSREPTERRYVDLMILRNRTPYEAASNFDLTCCQVWFDGKNVDGTHVEETLERKAFLNKEYLSSYVSGNKFTHNRMCKYVRRGFQVTIPAFTGECFEIPVKTMNLHDRLVSGLLSAFINLLGEHFVKFAVVYSDIFSGDLAKMVDIAFQFEKRLNLTCLTQGVTYYILKNGFEFAIYLLTEVNNEHYGPKANTLGPVDIELEFPWKGVFDARLRCNGYLSKLFDDLDLYNIFRSRIKTTTDVSLTFNVEEMEKENSKRDMCFFSEMEASCIHQCLMWIDQRPKPMTLEEAVAVAKMEYIALKKRGGVPKYFDTMVSEMKVVRKRCYQTDRVFKKALEDPEKLGESEE